jgi:hypothetical protein
MNCLLSISALCLLNPTTIEVRGDFSYQAYSEFKYTVDGKPAGGGHVGTLDVSAGGQVTNEIEIRYGLRHISLYDRNDGWGDNRWYVGVVWRPFL